MFGNLFILFIVLPALDLYLLVQLGKHIGLLPTFAMLFMTAALGIALARAEGLRVLREFQAAMAAGQVPAEGVASGLLVLLGGALLVFPGVLSDVVGVLLLVPFTRRLFARGLLSRMQRAMENGNLHVMHTQVGRYGGPFPFGNAQRSQRVREIIDVEAEVLPPADVTRALRDDNDDDAMG